MPRFSPDGRWIAFTGEYQGNRDVYVIPAGGGAAKRLTFTSDIAAEAARALGSQQHGGHLDAGLEPASCFCPGARPGTPGSPSCSRCRSTGGLPQPLPLDRGGFLSYSPDGKQIAYNRIFRDFRTWKRYDGGLAQDIDIYDFQTRQLKHVTDWTGTETSPMWFGKTIYFLADHDASRRRNIWAYDTGSGEFRQVTHFTDYDIDFPSLGAGPQDRPASCSSRAASCTCSMFRPSSCTTST